MLALHSIETAASISKLCHSAKEVASLPQKSRSGPVFRLLKSNVCWVTLGVICCVGIVVRQANMFSGECSSKREAVHFSSFESCDFFFWFCSFYCLFPTDCDLFGCGSSCCFAYVMASSLLSVALNLGIAPVPMNGVEFFMTIQSNRSCQRPTYVGSFGAVQSFMSCCFAISAWSRLLGHVIYVECLSLKC